MNTWNHVRTIASPIIIGFLVNFVDVTTSHAQEVAKIVPTAVEQGIVARGNSRSATYSTTEKGDLPWWVDQTNGWYFSSHAEEQSVGGYWLKSHLEIYAYTAVGITSDFRWSYTLDLEGDDQPAQVWSDVLQNLYVDEFGYLVAETGSPIVGTVYIDEYGKLTAVERSNWIRLSPGMIARNQGSSREVSGNSDFVHPTTSEPIERFRRWKATYTWVYFPTAGEAGPGLRFRKAAKAKLATLNY